MVATAGFAAIPTLASLPAPIPPSARMQWEAEFSRFFVFPRRTSSQDPVLRPLTRLFSGRGTWLTASSLATILIFKATSDAAAVFSVSVSDYVYEEHLLSSLQLSWPQVACVPQCPIRGSRVVFMSFRDCSSQVQKFALRFPTSAVAETFFTFVKDCSRETMDISPMACFSASDRSSPSEAIASNAPQYSQSQEKVISKEISSTAFRGDPFHYPFLHATGSIDDMFSSLPPSFTELLTTCSKEPEKEPSMQLGKADDAAESGGNASLVPENLPNPPPGNVTEQLFMLESDFKNEIMRYMSDASFQDMLAKIEKVIHELGGDLWL